MLTNVAHRTMQLHKNAFTWINLDSGEVVDDGLRVLYFIQQVLRPNINIALYRELTSVKAIKPDNFGNNVPELISKLDLKSFTTNTKIRGAYMNQSFVKDLFNSCLEAPCKRIRQDIQSARNNYLLGNSAGETKESIVSKNTHVYTNRKDNNTLLSSLKHTDQFLVLTTINQHLLKDLDDAQAEISNL